MNANNMPHILPVGQPAIALREGMQLKDGPVEFVVDVIDGVRVELLSKSGERKETTQGRLLQAITGGLVACESYTPRQDTAIRGIEYLRNLDFRTASSGALADAAAKLQWIDALARRGITKIVDKPWVRDAIKRLAATELKDVKRFALSTLYEAELKLRKGDGDYSALIPRYTERGAPNVYRIDGQMLTIIRGEIARVMHPDCRERIRDKDLIHRITTQVWDFNVQNPTTPIKQAGDSTIRRILRREIPSDERARRNGGKKTGNKMFRSNSFSRDTAVRPLEVSEFDDVDLRVFGVDDETGMPCGSVWVTNGIDQATGAVLGYDMSDHQRAYESMMGSIIHSLLPKEGDEEDWIPFGCQGRMLFDNASYNKCTAAKDRSQLMRLVLAGARPYGPTEKCSIENFNRIVKADFCPTLPGWSGPKGDRDAIDEGLCTAALDITQVRRMYSHWVRNIYMNMPGEDGLTPKQRWSKFFTSFGPAVRFTKQQLALMTLVPATLHFRESGGLERLDIRYDNDQLAALRRQLGATSEVGVYVNRRDLSYIMVQDPFTKALFRVDTTEDMQRFLRGLTEKHQRLIRAKCRERGHKNPDIRQMVAGRTELAEQVAKARRSNKLRLRKFAKENKAISKIIAAEYEEAAGAIKPKKEEIRVVTELEYQMMELEELAAEADQW